MTEELADNESPLTNLGRANRLRHQVTNTTPTTTTNLGTWGNVGPDQQPSITARC